MNPGFLPALLFVFCACCASSSAAEPATRPNVLFILTDDMGWGDLSSFGNREMATPNIDRLAKEGTRFTQFYVASPICSPSRVAYLTGMFPARWRINDYLHARAGNKAHDCADWLDPKAPTLARTLHDAGYATAHFGKWHMGGGRDVQDTPWPKEYGFDEHHVNCEGCGPRIDTYGSAKPVPVEDKQLARYEFTGFWADKAVDFMRRHKAGPFFVDLWPQDVHTPHVPDPEELPVVSGTPGPHRNFNAVLRRYDREVGRVLDFLKDEGLERNTLVIFASDNGPEPSFQRQRAGGLRGMKWSLYEGGIREPLLIRWPEHVPAGKTDSTTVLSSVDLFPTICTLAGVAMPQDITFDGLDVSAAWLGTPVVRDKPLFWEYGRKADYLFPNEPGARSPNLAVREGRWKLLINADGTGAELYDLDADPNESNDLASKKRDEVARLKASVLAWRRSLP
jgi:arylsulfatase A-like enzyme